MRPLPIGIQTFSHIIEGNYIYVDKTKHIYDLLRNTKGVYFLSRPRRFGKSLLLSTLKEIFEGNKELFRGLWIYDAPYEWKKYPIIRIDFSKQKAENIEDLKNFIIDQLNYIAEDYGISLSRTDCFSRLEELIRIMGKNNKVVVLIDEYDKPIIDYLTKPELAMEMREILKGFYTILKANDECLRFVLLTGVSKFSKAGVFSGLNQLEDISMSQDFSSMLGITEEELVDNFSDYIEEFAKTENKSREELLQQIRHWYNGYCFSGTCKKVYNPFSTLLLFKQREFKNHWFESGTPSFLINLVKKADFSLPKLERMEIESSEFYTYDIEDLSVIPLLFQTGYLTIKEFNREFGTYILGYPNYEVKNSFTQYLSRAYTGNKELMPVNDLIRALRVEDFETFFQNLKAIFANIDYDLQIKHEKYYQTIFYLLFTLIGLKIKAEVKTNIGRIDAVIDDKGIILLEFKLNGSAESALFQIKEKKYYEKYLNLGKKIFLIGAEFKDRNVGEWIAEELTL